MRISDWSSDVCSSDLLLPQQRSERPLPIRAIDPPTHVVLTPQTIIPTPPAPTPPTPTKPETPSHRTVAAPQPVPAPLPAPLAPVPVKVAITAPAVTKLAIETRSEAHTSEFQSLKRISNAAFCSK